MIWLRVKVNRTRLCSATHFARNEIKYHKSRESGLFQYILYACSIACLSFIPLYHALYKQKFYKCYSLSPSQKSEERKKLPQPISVTGESPGDEVGGMPARKPLFSPSRLLIKKKTKNNATVNDQLSKSMAAMHVFQSYFSHRFSFVFLKQEIQSKVL